MMHEMVDLVVCEICDEPIGVLDRTHFVKPMRGHMFHSLDPVHGFPPPFYSDADWEFMRCPWCRKRPFLEPDRVKLRDGSYVEAADSDAEDAEGCLPVVGGGGDDCGDESGGEEDDDQEEAAASTMQERPPGTSAGNFVGDGNLNADGEISRMAVLRAEGKSFRVIGREMGCSGERVRRLLKAAEEK